MLKIVKIKLFTDESGLINYENANVFTAKEVRDNKFNISFTVSKHHIVDKLGTLIFIDTGSDADL